MIANARRFTESEVAGGVLLAIAAVAALIISNSPLGPLYRSFIELRVADDQCGGGGNREQHAAGGLGLDEATGVGDQGCGRRSIDWSVTA